MKVLNKDGNYIILYPEAHTTKLVREEKINELCQGSVDIVKSLKKNVRRYSLTTSFFIFPLTFFLLFFFSLFF